MKSNTSTLRVLNKKLVLNIIRQDGPLSRAQIAKKVGLTRSTISEIVQELLREGIIYEDGFDNAGLGRKGILIHYNEDYRYVIGIDLGGTKISMGMTDFNGNLKRQKTISTFAVKDNKVFIDLLITEIENFIAESNEDTRRLHAIGIASPGIIDYKNGIVVEGSPNLPNWENLPLGDLINYHFHVPVVIENDVRTALIGEIWRGTCTDTQNAMLLSLGTGIGSALLIDGKIVRGSQNAAGEIGYMLFSRLDLQKDWFNEGGRLESLISGPSITQEYQYKRLTKDTLTAKEIFQLLEVGDQWAREVIDQMIDYASIAILNVITVINPEKVVLTGGISRSLAPLMDQLRKNIERHTLRQTKVQIEISSLHELAAIYGISILALSSCEPQIEFVDVRIQ